MTVAWPIMASWAQLFSIVNGNYSLGQFVQSTAEFFSYLLMSNKPRTSLQKLRDFIGTQGSLAHLVRASAQKSRAKAVLLRLF